MTFLYNAPKYTHNFNFNILKKERLKKLFLTTVASLATMLSNVSSANAQDIYDPVVGDFVMITSDNVALVTRTVSGGFEPRCQLNSGTKTTLRTLAEVDYTSRFWRATGRLPGIVLNFPQNLARFEEPAANQQEVFTTRAWGDDVPVFQDRNSFFNARDRNKGENVVCRLKKVQLVKFMPYQDWGLGEWFAMTVRAGLTAV